MFIKKINNSLNVSRFPYACAFALIITGFLLCFSGPGYSQSMDLSKALVVPPAGFIYTNYKAPLDINFGLSGEELRPLQKLKKGSSQAKYLRLYFLGFSFGWGDASIEAAVANGNIKKIHYIDYEVLSILGYFTRTRINVFGE